MTFIWPAKMHYIIMMHLTTLVLFWTESLLGTKLFYISVFAFLESPWYLHRTFLQWKNLSKQWGLHWCGSFSTNIDIICNSCTLSKKAPSSVSLFIECPWPFMYNRTSIFLWGVGDTLLRIPFEDFFVFSTTSLNLFFYACDICLGNCWDEAKCPRSYLVASCNFFPFHTELSHLSIVL